MKQSTKLLSLVLALVMAFSMVSVIGNAALVKSEVRYDAIDNADLTAEQVADLVLDLVDHDVLGGNIDDLDITVAKIRLDSIDHAIADIVSLKDGFLWAIAKGLLGDAGDLNFSPLNGPVQRSGGDLNLVYALLNLLSTNKDIISKVAYGLGTDNGLSIGVVGNFVNLDSVNEILGDLPTYLTKLVFDALLHGSYTYPKNSEELGTLPTEANNIDKILNVAAYNFLTTPQDYKWEGKGDDAQKVYDMSSIISKQFAALDANTAKAMINVNSNSILQIVDNIIQIAYNEFGDVVLNNDVKKLLMEATGADFTQIKDADLIARITSAPDYIDPAGENAGDVKNYLCNAQMWKYAGTWYFRDFINVVQKDANGEALLDEEGNEIKQKENRFFVATTGGANDFFSLVNWDYHFTDSDFDFVGMINANGSIFGCLNTLLYKILKKCINPATLDVDSIWTDGGNDNVNENLIKAAKWVITTYTRPIFGRDSEYVGTDGNATQAFIDEVNAQTTLIDLVAYIGLPFMNDAMPQLVMPKDANGDFAFTSGVQVLQLGALAIREFITDIAPSVNYDDYIFAAGSLTSASGRQFASHSATEWINIIINMGIDLGYTYLNLITNFNTAIPAKTNVLADADWKAQLDTVIMWAANYVGTGSTSVLNGMDPNTIASKNGPFEKLSYILNSILPLGFVSGCTSANYDLDVELLYNKLTKIVTDLDIEELLSFFGRNTAALKNGNLLTTTNVVKTVLDLAQKILALVAGTNLLPTTASCATLLTQANLKTIVANLLGALYNRRAALLENALPLVAFFIKDWGGEQEMGTPKLSLGDNVALTNGAVSGATFTVANGSTGVWRHGYLQDGTEYSDNQYKYAVVSAAVKDIEGNPVSGISFTTSFGDTGITLDFGQSTTVTYNVSGVPAAGKVVRFEVNYQVFDEDGAAMANGKVFTTSKYVYLSYNATDANAEQLCTDSRDVKPYVYGPQYIAYESGAATLPKINTFRLKNTNGTSGRTGSFPTINPTAAQKGITLAPVGSGTSKSNGISVSKDSSLYFQNFSVNEATYNAQTWTPGETLTWQVTGYAFAGIGTSSNNGTKPLVLHFYSAEELSAVKKVADKEAGKERVASDYNMGDCYASKVLTTVNDGETLRESAFSATGVDPETNETVTVINGATAWANYVTAFNNALRAAYQPWNAESVYNHQAAYEALAVAAADLDWCKKTSVQLAAEGGENNDTAVAAIKADLTTIATAMNGKSASDYKLYRWNRFTSARGDAEYLVNLQKQQSFAVADTQYFSYTNISVADLRTLVNGNQYSAYILALLKDYTAEQQTANAKNLDELKSRYANYAALDVEQIDNLLNRTYSRLLTRDGGIVTHYINDEIASAVAMLGDAATSTTYTERSWDRYVAALAAARTAAAGNSQDKMFDAKYELQVARNELVKIEDEADYSELEALINDATNVLANPSYYDNSNADFGGVLAALGMDALTDADGNTINLFPNAAIVVNTRGYDEGDQRKIDNAANALKVALSVMKFKAAAVTPVAPPQGGTGAVVENNVVLEEATDDTPAVVASVATIAAKQVAEDVKSLVTASATGAGAVTAVVSSDNNYTVNDGTGFVGTGATVTFYTEVTGIKVPVATVKIVVKGDVNGDGVIDALDAMVVELVSTLNSTVSGCFAKAADFDASGTVDAADFGSVVNTAIAG